MRKNSTRPARKWAYKHEIRRVFPLKPISHKRADGLHEAQQAADGLVLPHLADLFQGERPW